LRKFAPLVRVLFPSAIYGIGGLHGHSLRSCWNADASGHSVEAPFYLFSSCVQFRMIVAGGVRVSGMAVPTRKRPSGVTS